MRTGIALVLGLLVQTPALAQDAVPWKDLGNWEISVDTTIQNGCYAVTAWDSGTVLRIGLNPKKDNFYLLLGNKAWTEFQPTKRYDIKIRFDSRPTWDITAVGLRFFAGDLTYLHAASQKSEFLEEFMRQNVMKVSFGGAELDRVTLKGSRRAFNEVLNCQSDIDKNGLPASALPPAPKVTEPPKRSDTPVIPAAPGSGRKTPQAPRTGG